MKINRFFGIILFFGICGIALTSQSIENYLIQATTTTTTTISQPIISTRYNFDLNTGELNPKNTSTGYRTTNNIPGLQNGTECQKEIAIYIHGIWVGPMSLENQTVIFDRAAKSLTANNYTFPLIGFSWDSDTIISPNGTGWLAAKLIAKENGPKLAQFISDYKNKCQGTDIRLIAHSMGARVVLSALESLYHNQEWNSKHFKIKSVHLMGAAVDNEEVAKSASYIINNPSLLLDVREWYDAFGIKSAYGNAIEKEVDIFYNLYNPKDKSLGLPQFYKFYEQDKPLGLEGVSSSEISLASNYKEKNVQNEIPFNNDANGNRFCDLFIPNTTICAIQDIGDNHFGYVGFRDANNGMLIDDGAMNVVVKDWKMQMR